MNDQSLNPKYTMYNNEKARLLPNYLSDPSVGSSLEDHTISPRWKSRISLLLATTCGVICSCMLFLQSNPTNNASILNAKIGKDFTLPPRVEHLIGKNHHKSTHHHHYPNDDNTTYLSRWVPVTPFRRCKWVMIQFRLRDKGTPPLELKERYLAQSVDTNVFFRATAHLFWADFFFHDRIWGHNFTNQFLLHNDPDSDDSKQIIDDDPENKQRLDSVKLTRKSVWTWVTGDQHLSNFGAWRNRHGDVVFGVNDFDEAAIFDFQVDVVRVAVSIWNHARTNGFDFEETSDVIFGFSEAYIRAILGYEENENALLFELTKKTASGVLKKFLEHTDEKKSSEKLMTKFTTRDPITLQPQFIKGPIDVPDEDTHLAAVPSEMEVQIKNAFTATKYGATMMKLGWAVNEWDDKYFEVLDVAERVGSGIGSFGVDRYYVLLKGRDGLLTDDGDDGTAVILDVKFQPPSAVSRALSEEDAAWYSILFPNEASRVVEAQRRLTSYTDPFTGWIALKNLNPKAKTYSQYQPFSVRQRSPYKDTIDLDSLMDLDDFKEFVAQIGIATATSHVRGTVAKAPGDFKHVIGAIFGGSEHKRHEWGRLLAKAAHICHDQVKLDFECFRDYVHEKYGSPSSV